MTTRRMNAFCWLVTFCLSLSFAASAFAQDTQLPNIILCMGDDHGWEETGYNGHPHLKTPVLDEMAATGLRLDRFYAAHPSCSPTRGSVLTGRHPNRYGTFTPNHSTRPEEITIAQVLRKAGYVCGHFGKWHVGTGEGILTHQSGCDGLRSVAIARQFFRAEPDFFAQWRTAGKVRGREFGDRDRRNDSIYSRCQAKRETVFGGCLVRLAARTVQRSAEGPCAL